MRDLYAEHHRAMAPMFLLLLLRAILLRIFCARPILRLPFHISPWPRNSRNALSLSFSGGSLANQRLLSALTFVRSGTWYSISNGNLTDDSARRYEARRWWPTLFLARSSSASAKLQTCPKNRDRRRAMHAPHLLILPSLPRLILIVDSLAPAAVACVANHPGSTSYCTCGSPHRSIATFGPTRSSFADGRRAVLLRTTYKQAPKAPS